MDLFGCGTALVTPFQPDGTVDEDALRRHVRHQVDAGIELLVPCGSTGEAATLTEAEWLRVITVTAETAGSRVPVFAGCTGNDTAATVARVRQLASVPGLHGILTANPFYNRPGQEGQYRHFRALAEATALDVMLYNIPGRTGVNLEPATVGRLAEIPNIVALKESSGNIVQITELLTTLPRSFRVFAGDDAVALPVLALGGVGLISVAANLVPGPLAEMVRAALDNDWATARRINRRFFPLMQALFLEPNPAPVKAILAMLGRGEDVLRLPMLPVNAGTRARLERLAGELGLLVEAPPSGEDLRMF